MAFRRRLKGGIAQEGCQARLFVHLGIKLFFDPFTEVSR
jgi:hypothetical protein